MLLMVIILIMILNLILMLMNGLDKRYQGMLYQKNIILGEHLLMLSYIVNMKKVMKDYVLN